MGPSANGMVRAIAGVCSADTLVRVALSALREGTTSVVP